MPNRFESLRAKTREFGQEHVFRFWDTLSGTAQEQLLNQIESIDFPLMQRLVRDWVLSQPAEEHFDAIEPVQMIPRGGVDFPEHAQARAAGEAALREGQVGLFLVAGGQGTRLGFDGPKGAYPIGPLTGKTLFAYHAEKILDVQRRYGKVPPWYIMVSDANAEATQDFFDTHAYFGLDPADVHFLQQRMVPGVDEQGRFILEGPAQLAMNPNGHGGCLPAMVENGVLDDARRRGVQWLSFFQVDNWAVRLADPLFLGYHILRQAEMSSKNHVKDQPREAVGVHCLCDGEYRVIEYSELDLYPQLLETTATGELRHKAGNPAIHILSVDFVQRVYDCFEDFPWHRAHKKIPYVDETGNLIRPAEPNGYKFETFIFDALRLIHHAPCALEIERKGEYTPTKQFDGDNSVTAARRSMTEYWAEWIEAAGGRVPRDEAGHCAVALEISPAYAFTQDEFVRRNAGRSLNVTHPTAIDAQGGIEEYPGV